MPVKVEITGATRTTTTGEVMTELILEIANTVVGVIVNHRERNLELSIRELIFDTNKSINEMLKDIIEAYCKEHNITIE